MRHMLCLFGKITDSRKMSHVQATIYPLFSQIEKQQENRNLVSEKSSQTP